MARSTTGLSALAETVASRIRVVEDFPRPGIAFQDLCGVFSEPALLAGVAAEMAAAFQGRLEGGLEGGLNGGLDRGPDSGLEGGFDSVLAVEARGFVLGTAVSLQAGVPLVMARKKGKLPGLTYAVSYDLEYGEATLEIQQNALASGDRVLVVDDVLATGGTLAAANALVAQAGANTVGYAVALTISALAGQDRLRPIPLFSLLSV